ncbi:hypothetical protein EKO04_008458 [Ascochyta lentis]|uniref:BTB domain-containing protein n=1 Tax=Ascochyta lentis TaxID=205686 RepID=A0A8H7J122_9PLEO|nr:hypothetical protein EKO04_008458 [Ascochyta lentis]
MSTTASPKPPAIVSAQADGVVIVEVGPAHKKYYLHKALVVFHSEYFRKALQGSWKEAKEGIVRLEDVESNAFNVFVHWLYNQQIPEEFDYTAWTSIFGDDVMLYQDQFQLQIQAYALGDRLLAPVFRRALNDVIVSNQIMQYLSASKRLPIYQWAFANISEDRPLLQFLVNKFCSGWLEQKDDDNIGLNNLPQAFTARVLRRYSQLVVMSETEQEKTYCYSEHSSKEEQKSCSEGLHMKYDAERDFGDFLKDSDLDSDLDSQTEDGTD